MAGSIAADHLLFQTEKSNWDKEGYYLYHVFLEYEVEEVYISNYLLIENPPSSLPATSDPGVKSVVA